MTTALVVLTVASSPSFAQTITTPIALSGNQTLTWSNVNVAVKADITLTDNATLIIDHATFTHLTDYSGQFALWAQGNSKVIIRDSTIKSSPWVSWHLLEHASLEMSNVVNGESAIWTGVEGTGHVAATNVTTFHGTMSTGNSAVVDHAASTFIELVFPPDSVVDEALPDVIGPAAYSFPNQGEAGALPHLQLTNVGATDWGITYVPRTDITIRDTNGLVVTYAASRTFTGIAAEFSGLRAQRYADSTWTTGNARLRLVNTTTLPWSPIVGGTNTLRITDSELADNQFSSEHAKVTIVDSSASFVRANDFVEMTLERSTVSDDVVAAGHSIVTLRDTAVSGKLVTEANGRFVLQNVVGLDSHFRIGPAGIVTTRQSEVLSGVGSIKGSYFGTNMYNAYLSTDHFKLPLAGSRTYRITFQYRIVAAPSIGFEVLFISSTAAAENNFLPSLVITGAAGAAGSATLTSTLGAFADYEAAWNVIGTGAIVVDDIVITDLTTGKAIASETGGCRSACPFTDDPLTAGATPIRATHITELRLRIDALRDRFGLPLVNWTDYDLAGVPVKQVHLTELRAALDQVYVAAGRSKPTYSDAAITARTTFVKASHIAELRAAIRSVE